MVRESPDSLKTVLRRLAADLADLADLLAHTEAQPPIAGKGDATEPTGKAAGAFPPAAQGAVADGAAPGAVRGGNPSRKKARTQLEVRLRSPTAGRGRRENLQGLHDAIVKDHRQSPSGAYAVILDNWDRVTRKQFDVLDLVYGEGLSQSESARRLGISPSAVSERLARALERIRKGRPRQFPQEHE